MNRERSKPYLPLAIGALLLALLAALATLQYRWIGQVSELESHRLRASLAEAGGQFADELDREVARAFLIFRREEAVADSGGDLGTRLAEQYRRWLDEAPYPRLIAEILYIHLDEQGAPAAQPVAPGRGRLHAAVLCPAGRGPAASRAGRPATIAPAAGHGWGTRSRGRAGGPG